MKISWKKKESSSDGNNKKRSLPVVSVYPNLPFDQIQNEEEEEELHKKTNEVQVERSTATTTTKELKKKMKINNERNHHDEVLLISSSSSSSSSVPPLNPEDLHLSQLFQSQGNKLAEDGRYSEALTKWEAALTLTPERAVLHEQKAQILLEIGDSWNALKAATRATEFEPSWSEAWITLARAQLNFGEPDAAIESLDRALAIQPDSKEAQVDKQTALHLVKRRKQLHLSGLSATENRYKVGDKAETS